MVAPIHTEIRIHHLNTSYERYRYLNLFRYHSLSATPGLHAFIMAEREMPDSRATVLFGARRQVRSYVQVPAFTSRIASRRRHNPKRLSRLYTPNEIP
jgi:hypothetical protein